MQLFYRGQAYCYLPLPEQPMRSPQAINWRYRLPEMTVVKFPAVQPFTAVRPVAPQVMNWRYQLPTEV